MTDSPDGHVDHQLVETQESMFDPSGFETSRFESAEEEPASLDAGEDAAVEHVSDFPGHDLRELPDEASADDSFSTETRAEYAEPALSHELENPSESPDLDDPESGALAGATISAPQERHEPSAVPEPFAPSANDGPATEPAADASALRLTIDDFAGLEERVIRAIGLVRRERDARLAAEQRADASQAEVADLQAQLQDLHAQAAILEPLQREVENLRAERDQVRQRVERLLSQLDALDI